MGYGYTCEKCDADFPDEDPALMGQLHERWFQTTELGGIVAERFSLTPEETLTLCGPLPDRSPRGEWSVMYRQEFWGPREKKGYRCADCGRTWQEVREIDVHHVDPDGADSCDNLIGLCRRCHLRARHRRDTVPGPGPFEPDQPTSTGPKTPRSGDLAPGL